MSSVLSQATPFEKVATEVNDRLVAGDPSLLDSILRNRRFDAPEFYVLWEDAVVNERPAALPYLLSRLSLDVRNANGGGLAHLGAWAQDADFLRQVFARGVSPDQLDADRRTPLHLLATGRTAIVDPARTEAVIQLFLEAGANLWAKDINGMLPGAAPAPADRLEKRLFDQEAAARVRARLEELRLTHRTDATEGASRPLARL